MTKQNKPPGYNELLKTMILSTLGYIVIGAAALWVTCYTVMNLF